MLDFLLGWIKALRWQRLPEMDRLGDFLFRHLESIAAYCDHPVRVGVVESLNTTSKAILRRARGMRDDAMLLLKLKMGDRSPDPVRSRSGPFSQLPGAVLKSVKNLKHMVVTFVGYRSQ